MRQIKHCECGPPGATLLLYQIQRGSLVSKVACKQWPAQHWNQQPSPQSGCGISRCAKNIANKRTQSQSGRHGPLQQHWQQQHPNSSTAPPDKLKYAQRSLSTRSQPSSRHSQQNFFFSRIPRTTKQTPLFPSGLLAGTDRLYGICGDVCLHLANNAWKLGCINNDNSKTKTIKKKTQHKTRKKKTFTFGTAGCHWRPDGSPIVPLAA